MNKYNFYIYTKFTSQVSIEAENKEEAEEKLWELYNNGTHDPLDDSYADVETNIEYDGENHE